MKKLQEYLWLLLVVLFSYWSIHHLLLPGFFPMHDDTQVARVFVMQKALSEGVFPVRMVSDLGYGYGYPIFNFYAPFAYYIGAILLFVFGDALLATKLMMAVGIIFAGVSMYFLAKAFWGKIPALVAALLYVYAPYHAVNIYVRGAVAEYWAYAFLPLVFLGIWKLYREKRFRYVILTAISLAGIIISHNLSALMAAPFVGAYTVLLLWCLIKHNNPGQAKFLLMSLGLGIVLSAFYWLPAITEMGYTDVAGQVGGKADFRDHFICLPQLWESNWGYGGSVSGCLDGLSFRIGKLHLLFVALAIILIFFSFKKNKEKTTALVVSLLFFILALFFSISASEPIWEAFPPLAYIQYPWRFLSLMVLFASFISGGVLWIVGQLGKRYDHIVLPGLAILSLVAVQVLYWKLFVPQTVTHKTTEAYTNPEILRFETSKISDEYLPGDFKKPLTEDDLPGMPFILQNNAGISDVTEHSTRRSATVTADGDTSVLGTIAYFPGWVSYVNGREQEYEITQEGLVIYLPEGEHRVEFVFRQTLPEKTGNALSVAGIAVLIVGILYARKKRFL